MHVNDLSIYKIWVHDDKTLLQIKGDIVFKNTGFSIQNFLKEALKYLSFNLF